MDEIPPNLTMEDLSEAGLSCTRQNPSNQNLERVIPEIVPGQLGFGPWLAAQREINPNYNPEGWHHETGRNEDNGG